MKIVLATPVYPPEIGGPATYIKELAGRLSKNHTVTIVAFTDVEKPFPGTTLIGVSKKNPVLIRLIKFSFAIWQASRNAQIIYVQNAMAAGFGVALVHLFRRTPFVVKYMGDEAWERSVQLRLTRKPIEEFLDRPEGGLKIRLMMFIQSWVLRKAENVITPSRLIAEKLAMTYPIKDKRIITNYNPAEKLETLPFDVPRQKYQIALITPAVTAENLQWAIKAFEIVKKKNPSATLLIAGELQTKEPDFLPQGVTLLGKISKAETLFIRKQSSVIVMTQTIEGLSQAIMASYSSQVPIVAPDVESIREFIEPEQSGLLVRSENIEDLALAIERLFIDTGLREKLLAGEKRLLQEKFSWHSHLATLEKLFEAAFAKPSHKV